MRLSFNREDSSSTVKAMTPLKQVVAVKPSANRREDETKGVSKDEAGGETGAADHGSRGKEDDDGGEGAGGTGDVSSPVEQVATGVEKLSLGEGNT